MGTQTTIRDLILQEAERHDGPFSPKRMQTLLYANYRARPAQTTIRQYLSHLVREGRVQRLRAGAYAPLGWEPPVPDKPDDPGHNYVLHWLRNWFAENPLHGATRMSLKRQHEDDYGVPVTPEILDLSLETLLRNRTIEFLKGSYFLAPGVDPFE